MSFKCLLKATTMEKENRRPVSVRRELLKPSGATRASARPAALASRTRMLASIKALDAPPSEVDMIDKFSRHFDYETQNAIIAQRLRRVDELIEFLDRLYNVGKLNHEKQPERSPFARREPYYTRAPESHKSRIVFYQGRHIHDAKKYHRDFRRDNTRNYQSNRPAMYTKSIFTRPKKSSHTTTTLSRFQISKGRETNRGYVSAALNRAAETILRDMRGSVIAFVDDWLVVSSTMEQHLLDLDELFNSYIRRERNGKFRQVRATKKRDKIRRFRTHTRRNSGRRAEDGSIMNFSGAQNTDASQRFFGYGKFQRTFHSETRRSCSLLIKLTKKGEPWKWAKAKLEDVATLGSRSQHEKTLIPLVCAVRPRCVQNPSSADAFHRAQFDRHRRLTWSHCWDDDEPS
ncbi:unnamed protein product [Trichogramma brassicae]|uniref:Reverse transcriptase domain-containing protein n=1 Tax=Trichogramma brassicae TaxID=86971 RepID=A0A6H5I0U3_9HYME|nr:unnamed protein product [Trichogramma brassicae]